MRLSACLSSSPDVGVLGRGKAAWSRFDQGVLDLGYAGSWI
jgi:hypothetical protein